MSKKSKMGFLGGALVGLGLGIKAAGGNFKEWLFGKKGGFQSKHIADDKSCFEHVCSCYIYRNHGMLFYYLLPVS